MSKTTKFKGGEYLCIDHVHAIYCTEVFNMVL